MNLVEIARKTIEEFIEGKEFIVNEETKKKYSEKKACFVTITKNGRLRGCIGSLHASQPLWRDVQENAIKAGFYDPRFEPLSKDELKDISIEVSVLTEPKKLVFSSSDDLLNKLNKNMGIIIKKGFNSATFLPHVWEQLPYKKDFLEHLCVKAGLNKDEWKSKNIDIFYYFVNSEKEQN